MILYNISIHLGTPEGKGTLDLFLDWQNEVIDFVYIVHLCQILTGLSNFKISC